VLHHGVVRVIRADTWAPAGGFAVSRRTRSSPASWESIAGTVRIESRARAESRIWFEEPCSGWASMAMTVSDGRVQTCS
jgi:hypothetical protein